MTILNSFCIPTFHFLLYPQPVLSRMWSETRLVSPCNINNRQSCWVPYFHSSHFIFLNLKLMHLSAIASEIKPWCIGKLVLSKSVLEHKTCEFSAVMNGLKNKKTKQFYCFYFTWWQVNLSNLFNIWFIDYYFCSVYVYFCFASKS